MKEVIKGEEGNQNKVNKRRKTVKICPNGRDDEEKGEEFSTMKLNKRRRKTVNNSQNGSGNDVDSGRDVVIGGELNGSRDDEDRGSDIVSLMEERKGEEVNPNELNNRSGETGKNGKNDHDVGSRDNEESGRDDAILMEHEKEEKDGQNELNKSSNETGQNAHDVGEGSRSNTNILREEEKGVELNPRKLNRRKAAETVQIRSDDDDEANRSGSDSDIAILA
ncbi:hypothetical protein ACH5RR_034018 [Cinchona calisaya]|uniref:Uncharacterized protein n=1 Tax=Cinchona calisaya TaxID=153742 RepID=A0ABD2Y9N8_9GENT